jgi:D-alanyl-lipoteichoic acid acyltransferase DltB (MBOAT superfamily)
VLFNSYLFILVFLPVVLTGFAGACRLGRRAALLWLTAASLVFYGWWAPGFVPLLVVSVLANFTVGEAIGSTAARPVLQSWLLAGGIAADLATLIACKALLPALPPGISFFTFTQIGALLDRQAEGGSGRGLLEYGLLVGFFPHVIAGPIPTGREILPQLANPATWRLSADNLAVGGGIFVIGLLKKTLLADPLGGVVTPGFAAPESLALPAAWQTALAWSLQLYFDFSGYSDMAIGLGRMFNLRYPMNFASPYKAQSVIDYWQRWHMTLTRFLMHRLFSPLTVLILRDRRDRGWPVDRRAQRSLRGFLTMLAMPLMVTMAIAGVWHGSGWTYLVFGLLHGGFLAANHAWRLYVPGKRSAALLPVIARVVLTYLCVLVGAVVFRASSVGTALTLLGGMLGLHGISLAAVDSRTLLRAVLNLAWLCSLFAIVWCGPNTQQIMTRTDGGRLVWRQDLPWAVAFGCAATLGLLSIGGTGEFVYFQF